METVDLHDLESCLGIHDPWGIKSVKTNDDSKIIDVYLEIKNQKRLFGLFGASGSSDLGPLISGQWCYMPVGQYRSVIHAEIPESCFDHDDILSQSLINQFGFLGHPKRQYSNFIRQKFALYQIRGVEVELLSEIYNIDSPLVKTVIKDLTESPDRLKNLIYLPTENDPVWKNVLLDKQLLHTDLLPLKLLLSKLKLAAIRDISKENLGAQIIELRKFVVANAHLMSGEIDQFSGITSEKSKQKASIVKSKQSLLLPGVKNPLWLGILSGKLKLNSQSLPLNLLISKQRKMFLAASDTDEKVQAINLLRDYFRKNYRTLRSELLLINRMMEIRKNSSVNLPGSDHSIWQKVLENDDFAPSEHVAYNLLLARLRMQLSSQLNPVIKVDAAKYIREFIQKNQKVMRKEFNFLLSQSKAG